MTSLGDVYGGGVRTVVDRRRRITAIALFAVGVTMIAVAVLLATTGLRSWVGYDIVTARRAAGVLAGLGGPAAIIGIFGALPASDETRAAAAIGASLSVFGVLLFVYAYPSRWLANEPALAIATTAVYALGTLVLFWCLFLAVAMFNTRNDPGGSARVEITEEGRIRLVSRNPEERPPESGSVPAVPGLGGVGVLGSDPDGNVPTQTNVGKETNDVAVPEPEIPPEDPSANIQPIPTSDGGPTVAPDAAPEVVQASAKRGNPDPYCGNCAHFEYVDVGGEYDPYCGYHGEFMEDLDACDAWRANTNQD